MFNDHLFSQHFYLVDYSFFPCLILEKIYLFLFPIVFFLLNEIRENLIFQVWLRRKRSICHPANSWNISDITFTFGKCYLLCVTAWINGCWPTNSKKIVKSDDRKTTIWNSKLVELNKRSEFFIILLDSKNFAWIWAISNSQTYTFFSRCSFIKVLITLL